MLDTKNHLSVVDNLLNEPRKTILSVSEVSVFHPKASNFPGLQMK